MSLLVCTGGPPSSRLQLQDRSDFSQARFMESYESKHSDQSFTSRLTKELGVTAPPLRLDSQAKYGMSPCSVQLPCCACCTCCACCACCAGHAVLSALPLRLNSQWQCKSHPVLCMMCCLLYLCVQIGDSISNAMLCCTHCAICIAFASRQPEATLMACYAASSMH